MNFIAFKTAVDQQFQKMQQYALFVTKAPLNQEGNQPSTKDLMWVAYQRAFPNGTNEIFRSRRQHDCQCCLSFIRTLGNVVAIIDGKLVSIWDVEIPGEPVYQKVANAMSKLVKGWAIDDKFLHYAAYAGTDHSIEEINGNSHRWDHFYSDIATQYVMSEEKIATYLSEKRGIRDVFARGLATITVDSIDTVVDLLANGSLYRGEERESNLLAFRTAVVAYNEYEGDKQFFVLDEVEKVHPSIAKIRNSAMGKLLVAITDGDDLEDAVKEYEKKMAPDNYKRTSAVVTPAMKKKAQQFVEKHDLEPSLFRRHAAPTDITVRNTLFANRKAKNLMEGSVFDALGTKEKKQDFSRVEEVPVAQFLSKILPQAETLELFVENNHFSNLMSLTAPVHKSAKPILQWDNNFCWSYKGEMTDSIKEKVKAAGGVVDADLCCRLSWSNTDDLDLHMEEPDGSRINFSDRSSPRTGGQLDIDMNAPSSVKTRTPVENIFYKDKSKLTPGTYVLRVHQYAARERTDMGFEVNIDFMGQVWKFAYDKPMRSGEYIIVAKFKYSNLKGVEIIESLPFTEKSTKEWGIQSQEWVPVNMVMLSPNHWDDNKSGNKHWFFILDECLNPEPVRGFYNEFLKSEFHEHRKVFEVLGSVTKAPFNAQQMSGIGFSSTQRNHVMCRVSGAFNRTIKIVF